MALFTDKDFEILPDFLDSPQTEALLKEAKTLHSAGKFSAATVGKDRTAVPDQRGDQILWWDTTGQTPAQSTFIKRLNQLRETLNQTLFLGLHDWEGHYAHYPPGGRYEKHVDRFQKDDKRVLSTVFYLNERWESSWGGQLRLYLPQGNTVEVAPRGGTLALFFSDQIPHEVVKATMPRWSVAGWFRQIDTRN